MEFTGVTFNDRGPPGTWISMSMEFSVINSTEITAQSAYFMNLETTDKIIVYARNTESG